MGKSKAKNHSSAAFFGSFARNGATRTRRTAKLRNKAATSVVLSASGVPCTISARAVTRRIAAVPWFDYPG